ncbi:MAG TPA: Wzz/FepE/Etk N-terminal domain-containing protein [Bryobacteraceae bacterium]|nr:Wzz/FepE/Etk N-terminal domain-containing protein [Bryobacteraceae bacterium]
MRFTYSQPPLLVRLTAAAFSHWRLAFASFVVVFGAFAAAALLSKPEYQCTTKILVKNDRVTPLLGPDQHTTSVIYPDQISEGRLNSEIELITSTDLLRQVIQQTDLRAAGAHLSDNLLLRDVQKHLTVKAIKKSNLIEVHFTWSDPTTAFAVVKTLSALYLDSRIRLNGASSTSAVFDKQVLASQQALSRAEEDLVAFRKKYGIVSLGDETAAALQQAAALQTQLVANDAASEDDSKRLGALQHELGQMTPRITKEIRSLPNQYSTEHLNTMLVELRNKRIALESNYRPGDRVLVSLEQQIKETEQALAGVTQLDAAEHTTDINPLFESTNTELTRTTANLAGAEARGHILTDALNKVRARLVAFDQISVTHDQLARRVKEAETTYSYYVQQRDQSHTDELLDRNQVANVAISEQPYLPDLPASPDRPLILILGAVWALLMAVAAVFAVTKATHTLRDAAELEQTFGLPVLATVPLQVTGGVEGSLPSATFA